MQRVINSTLKVPRIIHSLKLPRYLSVLTHKESLSETFNKAPPSFVAKETDHKNAGLFLVPELCDTAGFDTLRTSCIDKTSELSIEAIDSNNRKRLLVQVFDDLSDHLCRVADLAEFIRCAHSSENYTKAATNTCINISGLVEKLNTNKDLYLALKVVVDGGDKFSETEICKRVGELLILDFQQSGIHLDDELREKIVALNDYIMQVGQMFVIGSNRERLIPRNVVPKELHKSFSGSRTHFHIHGLNSDANDPEARACGYRLFLEADPEQDQLLTSLLEARNQLAMNCGFNTYSERCLRGAMLDKPETVMRFLDHLALHVRPKALMEMNAIRHIRNQDLSLKEPLPIWDLPYYTSMYKSKQFNANSSDYSAYFSLGTCMQGLSTLFRTLYGITLNYVTMEAGECWAPDVYKLEVVHETEGQLGTIYCDFFTRSGKPRQDSHFTIRGGRLTSSGEYQMPIVVIMLNLQDPAWPQPCLLPPSSLETLFHEMGHAMHSMLGRTRYQHVTGTRCATDIAEVPSVLMEYFARDPRVLRTFARHHRTGEPMPEDMLLKLCESRTVLSASDMLLQTFYSALDQRYHGRHPISGTTTDIIRDTQDKYYVLPHVEGSAWQHRFGHLYGYGGKYYAYLTSRALASWIWSKYFDADPLNRESGERLRVEFLAHGGAKPPCNMIADFLGKEPTPTALAEALVYELDTRCHIPNM